MFFACKAGDKQYELPKVTIGEARLLKRHFGLAQIEDLNPTDPDHLAGLLFLCLRRESPGVPMEKLLAEVEDLDPYAFEAVDAPDTDPTPAVAGGGKSGKKATTRKTTGSQS